MKFPCTLKNALLIIRDHFGLSFASKWLGYLAALLLLLALLARYKLSCYQTTRYLQFQHLQTIPYWKLLVISFCSSLGSTLLLIEKSFNWSPILVGHHLHPSLSWKICIPPGLRKASRLRLGILQKKNWASYFQKEKRYQLGSSCA